MRGWWIAGLLAGQVAAPTREELRAYQLGRARQIDISREVLARLRCAGSAEEHRRLVVATFPQARLELEAALAARVSPPAWSALERRIDSLLLAANTGEALPETL